MGAKRALIVDDSKSARLFLARALERYDIDVDSAESAEAAIEYLGSNRPDVIFMDHLMPGMDGFQAVRAIKNDPRTATIPIMMYTSQQGELYLGQARALGAVGVLPKQIKPTDVSKVLFQLHLVPDRRTEEQRSFTPLTPRPGEVAAREPAVPAAAPPKALPESALREHFAELRRALVAGVDTQTERITAEMRALLTEGPPPPRRATARGDTPPWAWIVACAALAIALASTALWWRSMKLLDALTTQLTQLRERAGEPVPSALHATQPAAQLTQPAPLAATPLPAELRPIVIPVPYGADALGGSRLEVIRQLLARLVRQKAARVVDVRTFAGRFCLVGNALDGYSMPPDEMQFARCDVVGNPSEEALSPVQRTPLALANLIGATRGATNGALDVQVSVGDPGSVLAPYPPVAGDLTAGDWNRAGSANNRVEIRVR
ncbi:MAG: response regulator [Steroidobacteraceae bacterium]